MSEEPDDMLMPMLREIRSEIREQLVEMREEFSEISLRLDRLVVGQKTIIQAVMSKFVTGDFEERIFELERKVDSLMKAK